MTKDLWFESDAGVTHWCGGMADDKKFNNKPDPKVTQIEMTKWFNPTTLDKETGVVTCIACNTSPKDGELTTTIDVGE